MTTESLDTDDLTSVPVQKTSYATPVVKNYGDIKQLIKLGGIPGVENADDDGVQAS